MSSVLVSYLFLVLPVCCRHEIANLDAAGSIVACSFYFMSSLLMSPVFF